MSVRPSWLKRVFMSSMFLLVITVTLQKQEAPPPQFGSNVETDDAYMRVCTSMCTPTQTYTIYPLGEDEKVVTHIMRLSGPKWIERASKDWIRVLVFFLIQV